MFAWMLDGSTSRFDSDADGRPCEQAYPVEDVDAVFSASLRP